VVFLVVEGVASVREALCYVLLSFGIRGIPVSSRNEALGILDAEGNVEGAIIDIDNRDVEGIELVQELRENERSRGLAVIVHTIQSSKAFVMKMIEIGVAGYLLKPFSPDTVREKLAAILGKLATHNSQRRHIRVKPDPGDLARVHFRLSGQQQLHSGRIVDISLGGVAVELFNPAAPDALPVGARIDALEFALGGKALSPAASIILLKSRVLALRFDRLGSADTRALERYIFKKISS
jgi:two-component system chemotaxis response regulator CheY